MASIVTYGDGLRRIDFNAAPGAPRQSIRLGRMAMKPAQAIRARVEAIAADRATNRPHDAELSAWLAGLDEALLGKLRRVGLADGVGLTTVTLGEFLERYFGTLSVKPATRTAYAHTRRNLESYFGTDRPVRSIGPADADGWRSWLVENEKLSPPTVARRVVAARTFWRKAQRWGLAAANPFADVTGGHQANPRKLRFIPQADVRAVLDEAPDAEWRALIVLARWGGLRTPSEPFALRWGDVDWDRGVLRVSSPKLAHHEAFAERSAPLFPECRAALLELFELAEPGTEFVFDRLRRGSDNPRQHFGRLIRRAGLQPWPRPWHNLRASRETELLREYELATVARWLGHSVAVAARHYVDSVSLSSDFQRAVALPDEAQQQAQQNAQQSAAAAAVQRLPDESGETRQRSESTGFSNVGQRVALAGKTGEWALLDSNQ